MSLSSPNTMIWTYFDGLRGTVARANAASDPTEQKKETMLSLILAVATVEVFINIYFRVLVSSPKFQQHEKMVLNDLDSAQTSGPRSLDYKLRNWPPKVLGKSLAWQTGVAKDFDEMRKRRNALMHFTSSHETLDLPGMRIQGLVNTTVYDNLTIPDATDALGIAEGMVSELLRLQELSEEEMVRTFRFWTGSFSM